MTDYYAKLKSAVSRRPGQTRAERDVVYGAARNALIAALQKIEPPPKQSVFDSERREFEAAVVRLEAEIAPPPVTPRKPLPPLRPLAPPKFAAPPQPPPPRAPSPPPLPKIPSQPPVVKKEKPMSRLDEMNKILRKLQSDSPGVEASALISEDGLMMASALSGGIEETRIGGMTATLLNLGTRAAAELGRGAVREIIIRGENGYAVVIDAGRGVLLLTLANESAKLGLIFFDMNEAVRALKKVL
jgi:predicted regulator of Ras-like GTPase activity (Roadblock/LC7/MglB family)